RLLARGADVSESHAVGGKKRGERMNQYLGHAERIGDETGVLPASTAEAVEGVARDVVAALHRDLLDRVRHVLDGNLDEAVANILGGAAFAAPSGEPAKRLADRVGVERQVLLRAEDLRKELRHQFTDHDVGVGERERPAAPVTLRPRIGAGAIGSDPEAGS